MPALTPEQESFLDHHGVPLSRVFDAAYMTGRRLLSAMKEADALVAVNTNHCTRSYEHRMKLRSGHCAQCKPEGFGFLLREEGQGEIYIATGEDDLIVKVGTSTNLDGRLHDLNRKRYGGVSNWRVVYRFPVRHGAGRVERAAHDELRRFRIDRTYYWAGAMRSSYEMYCCTPDQAISAVQFAIDIVLGFNSN